MELRQLEYFVVIAEEANFTRAAARMHVTQPGVSAQIRQLERELGQELLDRSGRTVRLTQAGEAVLPYATAALAAARSAQAAADEVTGLIKGKVRVGMVTACGALDLPDLLASFHQQHEGVEITLAEANSDELLEGLRAGALDLAWIGLAGPPPAGIATQVILDDELMAAVAPGDRWAGRKSIRLSELATRPVVSLPVGTGLRSGLDQVCAEAGVTPRVAFEAAAPHMVARLASQGLGVAILPASIAQSPASGLHPLRLIGGMHTRIELAWRSTGHTSPAARALIRHAREALAPSETHSREALAPAETHAREAARASRDARPRSARAGRDARPRSARADPDAAR